MFVRLVRLHLKPHCAKEFTRTIEKEILPMLRRQKGFQDLLTFVTEGEKEAVGISFWDGRESAEFYSRERSSEVFKVLAKVVDGAPRVQGSELPLSTLQKNNPPRAA
jgi:heme-degrading monooxygenase HmoA